MVTKFNPEIEREFVEPSSSDHFIWWLFKRRCIHCNLPATEINEIVPRSRSKGSIMDWRNRVTMCHVCHMSYHQDGVTNGKIQDMNFEREKFLKMIGRSEYLTCP
jgi:hypothetical protein